MRLQAPSIALLALGLASSFGEHAAHRSKELPRTQAYGKPINLEINIPQLPGDGVPSQQTIVGGFVSSKRYPWLASLQAVDEDDSSKFYHQCGGILIAPQWVLTAAHCGTAFTRVCLGGINLENLWTEFECIPVESHIRHPSWGWASFVNDIQLVKLQWYSSQSVAQLNMDPSNVKPFTDVLALGWGISEDSNSGASQQLRNVYMQLNDVSECDNFSPPIPSPLAPGMICDVGVVGKGTCNGDSGGPILLGDQKTVVGIVSFGSQECELGFPTIYTNVLNYLQWIGETTGMDKLANACPCMNGGTCTGDVWSGITCNCPSDYTDPFCGTWTSTTGMCMPRPCMNGGSCKDLDGVDYECKCQPGYVGRQCETPLAGTNEIAGAGMNLTTKNAIHMTSAAEGLRAHWSTIAGALAIGLLALL